MQIHKGMVSDHHSACRCRFGDYDYVCEDGGIFEAHQPSLRRGDQQLGLLHAYEHVSDCRGGEIQSHEIEESARIDGCGPLKTYWTIVFPLIKGTVFTVASLNVITY